MWTVLLACAGPAPDGPEVSVVNGGLLRAGVILQARFGTMITYEGVPRNVEGITYRRDVRADGPNRVVRLGDGALSFRYREDATPLEAVEAAVSVANARPDAYAHFRAVEDGDLAINLVPYEVRTLTGWEDYVPLFDTVPEVPGRGDPTNLYRRTLASVAQQSGVSIRDPLPEAKRIDSVPSDSPQHEHVVLRDRVAARLVLDDIVSQADSVNTWMLLWVEQGTPTDGWSLGFNMVQPSDDGVLNQTPLAPR